MRINNNVVAALAVIFILTSLFSNWIVFEKIKILGYATARVEFSVTSSDINAPTYSNLNNNGTGIKANGYVNFSISINDNVGLSSIAFYWNNSGSWAQAGTAALSGLSAFYNKTLTVTATRGKYVCGNFSIKDSSNNENKTVKTCFTVANTAPTISAFTPTDTTPSVNEGSSLAFSITASDADSDTLNYRWTLDGTNVSSASSYTYSPGYSAAGTHIVNASANDSNSVVSQSWSVTVNDVSEAAPPGGGGGGGGGGGAPRAPKEEFETDKEFEKIQITEEGSAKSSIEIRNTGETPVYISVEVVSVDNLIKISETLFSLNIGESKTIELVYRAVSGMELGVYNELVILKSAGYKKTIPVTIEIESRDILFDISINIPGESKDVLAGKDVVAQLTLINLMRKKDGNVTLDIELRDSEGNVLNSKSETLFVENQASFTRAMRVPAYVKPGDYLYVAIARYGESVGTASETFHVVAEKFVEAPIKINWTLIMMIAIVVLGVFTDLIYQTIKLKRIEKIVLEKSKEIYERHKKKEAHRIRRLKRRVQKEPEKAEVHKRRVGRIGEKCIRATKNKLERHLLQLERAYRMGYIKKPAYDKGRRAIEEYLRKMMGRK